MPITRNKTIGGVTLPIDAEEPKNIGAPLPPEPIVPGKPAEIGEIVLFSIGPNVFRPFLVVALKEKGKVNGTLFLDAENDKAAAWVRKYAFTMPSKQNSTLYLQDVEYGEGQGQWRRSRIEFIQELADKLTPKSAAPVSIDKSIIIPMESAKAKETK